MDKKGEVSRSWGMMKLGNDNRHVELEIMNLVFIQRYSDINWLIEALH